MGNKATKKSRTSTSSAEDQEEEVDYGATADGYFSKSQDDEEEEQGEAKDGDVEEKGSDNDDDNDDASVEDIDEDKDDEASSEGDDDPQEANDAAGEEACSFDLRNLTAVNSHPLQETLLFKKNNATKSSNNSILTIGTQHQSQELNDDYLLQKATEGCTQLIEALWQLPTERSDAGPLMTLPSYNVLEIPRALPPPPPKAETKWEKFAKEKGIALNKEKRSRKVWDEASQTWKFRHGYDKANVAEGDGGGSSHKWPIMEVGANDDPFEDPWEKQRDAKYDRAEQNRQSQLKNQERAGVLTKGTTNRVIKSREDARKTGKAGGQKDNQTGVLPTGVPVDMNSKTLRGKTSLSAALKATQASTASLGRFDKLREGEPERKFPQSKKKRKMMADTSSSSHGGGKAGEQERGMKVLQQVLHGGGVEKEKARKKGKLAKGVTAYDYEYDDGADKALFSKKKGRGGIGKNKKMTKKRIK